MSPTWQAYLEFFTCKEVVDALLKILKEYPQVNYHVVNCEVSWIYIRPYSVYRFDKSLDVFLISPIFLMTNIHSFLLWMFLGFR